MGNKSFTIRPFEKLKKKIARSQEAGTFPPSPARRKKKEEYTDEELFNREMDDVQEIAEFRSLACAQRPDGNGTRRLPRNLEREDIRILSEIAAGERPMHLPDTQEYVEWTNPDYHDTIVPMLHEGRFSVQAFLDLHGFTVAEAEAELDMFFEESFKKGRRCVKIIHGRGLRSVGGPVIKAAVVRRLSGRFRKHIVAYVTARQCDGGLGALYVLLRNK